MKGLARTAAGQPLCVVGRSILIDAAAHPGRANEVAATTTRSPPSRTTEFGMDERPVHGGKLRSDDVEASWGVRGFPWLLLRRCGFSRRWRSLREGPTHPAAGVSTIAAEKSLTTHERLGWTWVQRYTGRRSCIHLEKLAGGPARQPVSAELAAPTLRKRRRFGGRPSTRSGIQQVCGSLFESESKSPRSRKDFHGEHLHQLPA